MLELCDYIYNNFPNLRKMFARWQILSMLDKNEDKIIFIKDDGEFKGVAFYVKVSDEILEEFKVLSRNNPEVVKEVLSDAEFIKVLLQEEGDNIHFLFVSADSFYTIQRMKREVIKREKAETISWFRLTPKYKFKLNKIKQGVKNEKVYCQTR